MTLSTVNEAERELAELIADQLQLKELRAQYKVQLEAAEHLQSSERTTETLDALQRAKSLLNTVQISLQEQKHEIAKARAYVAELQEEGRNRLILDEVRADAGALALMQAEHSHRLRKLQEDVWQEIMSLDALRAEWRSKQAESWRRIGSLGVNEQEAVSLLENVGIDLSSLRLAAPTLRSLLPYQTPYTLPITKKQEMQPFAKELLRLAQMPEIARELARLQLERDEAVVRRQQRLEANSRFISATDDE